MSFKILKSKKKYKNIKKDYVYTKKNKYTSPFLIKTTQLNFDSEMLLNIYFILNYDYY